MLMGTQDPGNRYARNRQSISEAEQTLLAGKHVLVAGCGGIGGHVIEALARLGVGHLTVVDGDVFEESNLNRQLLATQDSLGQSKAMTAAQRIQQVNPLVEVSAVPEKLTPENAKELLEGVDVAVDALDNVEARMTLFSAAAELGIPAVHASIAGWSVRVAICMPGDEGIRAIATQAGSGLEKLQGNLPFTAQTAGALEAAQVAKLLLGRKGTRKNEQGKTGNGVLLEYDLLYNTFDEIEIRSGGSEEVGKAEG